MLQSILELGPTFASASDIACLSLGAIHCYECVVFYMIVAHLFQSKNVGLHIAGLC